VKRMVYPREPGRMNYGGLVHRSVRSGAILLIFGALQFLAAMLIVQSRYPGYSLSQNYISDLGGVHSPWALGFDASVILLGVCAIFGILLVWGAFEASSVRGTGLAFILIGGLGAIGVGVFPETTPVLNGGMHTIVSFVAFVGAGIGLTILSFAMASDPHYYLSRPFTLACGAVTLVAIGLFAAGQFTGASSFYLGLGPGGMERTIVAPILLWAVVEGIHLARLPRFAPSGPVVVTA
jgi:hypothetical membrane protein